MQLKTKAYIYSAGYTLNFRNTFLLILKRIKIQLISRWHAKRIKNWFRHVSIACVWHLSSVYEERGNTEKIKTSKFVNMPEMTVVELQQ